MANIIRRSPRAVEAFVEVVSQSTTNFPLSTVTAASFHIKNPLGTQFVWPAILSNQSNSAVTITYPYQNGDLDITGDYEVFIVFTVPGGFARTVPKAFTVVEEFTAA